MCRPTRHSVYVRDDTINLEYEPGATDLVFTLLARGIATHRDVWEACRLCIEESGSNCQLFLITFEHQAQDSEVCRGRGGRGWWHINEVAERLRTVGDEVSRAAGGVAVEFLLIHDGVACSTLDCEGTSEYYEKMGEHHRAARGQQ